MNFASHYQKSFLPGAELSQTQAAQIPPADAFFYPRPCVPPPPIAISAVARIKIGYAWSVTFLPMPYYRLLWVRSGSGFIESNFRSFHLKEGSFVFIPANLAYRLLCHQSDWEYLTVFLSGSAVEWYHQIFCRLTGNRSELGILSLSRHSSIPAILQELCASPARLDNPLWPIDRLTQLFHHLLMETTDLTLQEDTLPPIPVWLQSIRNDLSAHYDRHISLEDLEEQYGISRYRIVREFTAAFGAPPITWLNEQRLTAAAALLAQSEHRVNEVGSLVGFDNTNHFIRLFRRRYGFTPGEYRKRQQAALLAIKTAAASDE